MIEVYLTKYALTTGIQKIRGEFTVINGRKYFSQSEGIGTTLYSNRDVFESREEAEANAKIQARKKLDAVKKQVKKLEKLVNEPQWGSG